MEIDKIIEGIIRQEGFQKIIDSEDFYFEELSKLYEVYKNFNIDNFREKLKDFIVNQPDSFKFQDLLDNNTQTPYSVFLLLIGKMIAIFDEKGYNKKEWNPYPDYRVVSRAQFTQNDWTYCLFKYKLNAFNFSGLDELKYSTFRLAMQYLNSPEKRANITSQNHIRQILEYFKLTSEDEIITLFPEYTVNVRNPKNRGRLVSSILYYPSIKKIWLDGVIGLMASDGTDWQDNYIKGMGNADACVTWNSKRPSGTNATLKSLKNVIDEEGKFPLYYSSRGNVNYRANIIDFVENQEELDKKQWNKKYNTIVCYEDSFEDYTDENKSANIVFLAKSLEKLSPIPVSQFQFYKNFSPPTQDNLSPIKSEPLDIIVKVNDQIGGNEWKNKNPIIPLNTILYGPPGTGKTFNTIEKAITIAYPGFIFPENPTRGEGRKLVKMEYERLCNDGQIAFITFHQSMSYEDFIEGIKPLKPEDGQETVLYDIVPGLFKRLCTIAQEKKTSKNFDEAYEQFTAEVIDIHNNELKLYTPSKSRPFKVKINSNSSCAAIPETETAANMVLTKESIRNYILNETIRDWKPYVIPIGNYIKDKYKVNVQDVDNSTKNFVLIIDEINRGNISQIFGELITLIEEDKRLGNDESLEVTLPYSKERFGVPKNLFIIGTMNTADRSVEALDTALRRRFSFEFVPPDAENVPEKVGEIELRKIFETINERLTYLLDADHQIGHSYFMNITKEEEVIDVFKNRILPLLKEYFYNDFGKIRLVLGDGFVEVKNAKPQFAVEDEDQIMEKVTYFIRPINEDFPINEALEKMLNE